MSVGAWNVSRGAPRSAALALAAVLSAVLVASCVEGARFVPAGEGFGKETSISGRGLGLDLNRNLRVDPANGTALDRYVAIPTPEYEWKYNASNTWEGSIPLLGSYTVYTLNVTSQEWLTEAEVGSCGLWQHAVAVVVPHNLDKSIDTALIWPTNGDNPPKVPTDKDFNMVLVTTLAVLTKSVVVSLFQCPNQLCSFPEDPKHDNRRSEDSLIAYTWLRYLELMHSGDPDGRAFPWPSHMPMTKSIVRAMDATQEFLSQCEDCGFADAGAPGSWIVFGASKRGWATWLTAAVDKRVVGIAPVVMDLLHMHKGFHRWWQNYGGWTFIGKDYFDEGLFKYLDSPEMQDFFAFEDPIVYKDRYTDLPKLIVTATGDEFFQVTDDHLWFDEMNVVPGKNLLLRAPNADHFEVTGISKIIPSLATWTHKINEARQASREPEFPLLKWNLWSEGEGQAQVGHINVTLDLTSPGALKPLSVHLRHAHTDPRHKRLDFRWFNLDEDCDLPRMEVYGSSVCPIQLVWLDDALEPVVSTDEALVYSASMGAPENGGFAGFYIQFEFPGQEELVFVDLPLTVNTQVQIVPDTLPFSDCKGGECEGHLV